MAQTMRHSVEVIRLDRGMQQVGYEDLQKAREEIEHLKQLNEELQRFTAAASHDLREPLRTVAACARLLADRYSGRLDTDADEFLEFIVAGAKSMTQLVSDLLEYSRLGGSQTQLISLDSRFALDSALRNLRTSIAETGAVVTSGRLPKVLANNQLTQVFQNLIANSIKYRAKAKPEIRISARSTGAGYWRFSVADNGIGFDMAHLDKLFQPLYRVPGKHQCAGAGMGLAICRRIVDRFGGEIWARSEPAKGSTFFFTVRVSPEAQSPPSSASSSPDAESGL